MTLPASGTITFGQVNTELSLSATAAISLNDAAVRGLFGVASGAISMSNGWGKSAISPGGLWTVGYNTFGPLGLGDVVPRSSPVQVGSLTNWLQMAGGGTTNLPGIFGIKSDGTLWGSGINTLGQLGVGDRVNRSSPTQVGSLTNWKQVSASGENVYAVKTDGTLWAWGADGYGQIGDGTVVAKSSPVQVGSLTNWSNVSCGYRNAAAVKTDGTLWTWGSNTFGQIGNGTNGFALNKSSPVQVGALTNWKQVACGYKHVMAIKTDGTMWGWGRNVAGSIGDGTLVNKSSPVQVGSLTDWTNVVCGFNTTIALRGTTMWVWGHNLHGQLGQGDIVTRSSPVQYGSSTSWSKIGGGYDIVTSIDSTGRLWVCGYNDYNGALGLGDLIPRSSPTQVGSLTTWKQLSTGALTINNAFIRT